MSSIIFFNGEINDESVNELIVKIEEARTTGIFYNAAKPSENIEYDVSKQLTVHFSSTGGILYDMYRLMNYFEGLATPVKFVFYNEISSCAFEFAVKVKAASKEVLQHTVATLHLISAELDYRAHLVDVSHRHAVKALEGWNNGLMNFYQEMSMPESVIQQIYEGKNYVLYEDELKKYINGSEEEVKEQGEIEGRDLKNPEREAVIQEAT